MQESATAGFWLSPQQKFVWKLEQESVRVPLRSACLVSLSGELSPAKLRQALNALAARHEILRTVFRRQTGMKVPFQVVLERADIFWTDPDLSHMADCRRQSEIEKIFRSEQAHVSNLESDAPLRAVLVRCGPASNYLVLSVPALCADAHSLRVMVEETGNIYGEHSGALPESFRYAQFAQWQMDVMESEEEDARQARQFWKNVMGEEIADLVLPGKRDPAEAAGIAELFAVRLDDRIFGKVKQRHDVAAFLLSAWEALLGRLSGQNSFRIGLVADGREYEELETAIGCFARTLPLVAKVENSFRFADVLRQCEAALQESVAVQEYCPPDALGNGPEVISFAFRRMPEPQAFGGVEFGLERVAVVSERAKLRLVAVERGEGLELEFHYDAARLERSTVERIAGYYQTLLAAAVADPETLVWRLPLLSEAERRKLLVEWNQTTAAYPERECWHELFEQQALKTPERTALRCGEEAFTYRELNQRANQLAHYLRRQGVGADQLVGLCLERSAAAIVAVLGTMKAGGAYVPLNPDNPPARLKQQLEGAVAVITEAKLAGNLPQFTGAVTVLDRDGEKWAAEPKTNPEKNTTPENLVYVIYTSGSTGVPKGVGVRHRNLVNYSSFITRRLELEKYPAGLEFATVSTLGADLGNTCIYPSLISGGCLHVVRYETATDPKQFADYVSKHPVDVLKIVPSHLQALLHADDAKKLLPRTHLIFGGETLTPKLVEKIESLNPSCEILNHYGPTETTVGSLTLKLNMATAMAKKEYDWKNAGLGSIPIGRPIQNTQVYVLDQNLEPVPTGVTGELYIAGAGVTAGYLGQAEKTAERFVRNPFSNDAKAKMYRTGDLARYGEDGNLEFLGRGDDQVKVRGFRIELGEIEAVLGRHAAVKQAFVLAKEDAQGEKRLLGYVVASKDAAANFSGEELRTYLKQELPEYMVPQAIVILPKLPLNANGKIDRKALPEPDQAQPKTYLAPRSESERTITEIWAEVLRKPKDRISVDDNFFDLGGHSLLATQVISRIRSRFRVEIAMRSVFEQPTIEGLALAVEQSETAGEPLSMGISALDREAYRAQ
jgi:amino acid adenylation domain-containing protein